MADGLVTPIDPTSAGTAIANILATSTAQVPALNSALVAQFTGAFNDWKISVDAGHIDPDRKSTRLNSSH